MDKRRKAKKIKHRIDKHLKEISEHQNRVFKVLLKLKEPKTAEEYEILSKVVGMYKDNEKTLSGIVEIYEGWLEEYSEELGNKGDTKKEKEKVNISKT